MLSGFRDSISNLNSATHQSQTKQSKPRRKASGSSASKINKSKTGMAKGSPLGEQAESPLHHNTLQSHAKLYSKFVNLTRSQPKEHEPSNHSKQKSMPTLLSGGKAQQSDSDRQIQAANDEPRCGAFEMKDRALKQQILLSETETSFTAPGTAGK